MTEEKIVQNENPQPEEFQKVDSEETLSLIDKANEAAERLEKAGAKFNELLRKQERMIVENKLSGVALAGKQEKSQEEKDIEGARNLLKGSGFEDIF